MRDNFDFTRLRELISEHFSYSEIKALSFDLRIDFDDLSGTRKDDKIRELIAYMVRTNRLLELMRTIEFMRPDLMISEISLFSDSEPANTEAANLSFELTDLRQQITELQKKLGSDEDLRQRVNELVKTANRAVGHSEELTARVILPKPEDMNVRLVNSQSLDQLEEYRSDENIAYLLIGLFGGAILGILANWATNEDFIITRFSVVLMFILAILTLASILWTRRIYTRANAVREKMVRNNISQRDRLDT